MLLHTCALSEEIKKGGRKEKFLENHHVCFAYVIDFKSNCCSLACCMWKKKKGRKNFFSFPLAFLIKKLFPYFFSVCVLLMKQKEEEEDEEGKNKQKKSLNMHVYVDVNSITSFCFFYNEKISRDTYILKFKVLLGVKEKFFFLFFYFYFISDNVWVRLWKWEALQMFKIGKHGREFLIIKDETL